MYGMGIGWDEGVTGPGWFGLGGNCCIDWENCGGWFWPEGTPTFDEEIFCPIGRNCWEAAGMNGFPCCPGTAGRNCRK